MPFASSTRISTTLSALGVRQRRVLARRAARAEKVNAGVDLPAPKPPNRLLVEVARLRERRDERRPDAGEIQSS